ncbi:flavin reductase family protein [Pseudomonas sp. OTU5201]|uniref:flavin reductase family protein n=1 Tax=Pseudomonas sp. OTU5201 TaxID=3043850 RepID=UPI00313BACEA
MPLIPLSLARRASPALRPLRALAALGWLQEAELDCLLRHVHPVLRLNRVFARVEARRWVADDMLVFGLRTNGNALDWRPGQHVRLYLELDGVRHGRSYSLVAVQPDGRIELAVKRQAGGRLSNWLLDRLEVGAVLELDPAHSALACGPHGFVADVHDWWQAAPREGRLQVEAFTPPAPSVETGEAVRLRFARSHQELPGNSAANLLEQAEGHGLRPAHGCRQGICAVCTCQLLAGSVRDLRTGALTHGPGLPIRLCISAPVGDVELEL